MPAKLPKPIEPCYVAIGKRILTARTSRGVSRRVLVGKLNMSISNLQNIESGKQRIPIHCIKPLCRALLMNPTDLLRGVL